MSATVPLSALADEKLQARAEVNHRYSNERSITMTEFWVPFMQDDKSVFYGDLRMMGDNQDNREGNIGVGYRRITELKGFKGIAGVHGWIDRRITSRGSTFHQLTIGTEWLGEHFDILVNGYVPLSSGRSISVPNANPQAPALVGTGIVVDTNGRITEEPQGGFDIELGFELGQYFKPIEKYTDSFRIYGGGYYFDGDNTESVAGLRARFTADITSDIQIGARFQRDDERGSQGFLEAAIRFPFGQKKKYRAQGLYARLDESPERDIDIITGETVTDSGDRVQVLNKETGTAQEVLHVDNSNTAVGGGDGSAENPFNTLAAAEGAASAQTIIYVNRGDGMTTGQNAGITLNQTGQQLIGSGTDFIYDAGRFTTANGVSPTAIIIASAGAAPIITNTAGDGINVTADNITVAGLTVNGATQDGIRITGDNATIKTITTRNNTRNGFYGRNINNLNASAITATGNTEDGIKLEADGAGSSLLNATLSSITATGNKNGVRFYAQNDASLSGSLASSIISGNAQHGAIIYDDSNAGSVNADLGGGSMGSTGNNVLAGNTLEDLAVELDGATLSAQNNWWGQASGADTNTPDIGIAPQIYYGAPINDGLVGNWTFDNEWTTNTTAYDRSGQGNNGTLQGGLSLTDQVAGQNRQALNFDGVGDYVDMGDVLDMGLNDWTTVSWVNTNLFAAQAYFISKARAADQPYRYATGVRPDGSYSPFMQGDGGGDVAYNGNSLVADGSWKLLTSVFDRDGNIDSYIGDVLDRSISIAHWQGADMQSNNPFRVGAYTTSNNISPSRMFNGFIDNTRIYNRALPASEISELYRMDTSSAVNTSNFLTSTP